MAESGLSLFFQCHVCEKLFVQYSELKSHWKTHGKTKVLEHDIGGMSKDMAKNLDIEVPQIKESEEKQGEKSDMAKSFICGICEKSFSRKGCLKIHMTIHTGEKPHRCSECGKCFSHKIVLQRHNMTHTGEKPFKCDICDGTYSKKSTMQRHRRTHTGEKPFECGICHNTFTQSGNLNKHIKTHDKEYRYICDFCGKTYRRNFVLQRHIRAFHEEVVPVNQEDADDAQDIKTEILDEATDHILQVPHLDGQEAPGADHVDKVAPITDILRAAAVMSGAELTPNMDVSQIADIMLAAAHIKPSDMSAPLDESKPADEANPVASIQFKPSDEFNVGMQ